MPDDDLTTLTAALAGDLDAHFERLVTCFADRLYAFALRLTASPADAEEIVQDAFVRGYRALQGYEAARVAALALRPWLYQITLNVARNRMRGRRALLVPLAPEHGAADGQVSHPELVADEREEPAAVAERRAQGAELAALVAALPERYRAAVILRHVEDLSYAEIAGVLGQPIGTVKANVHRGVRLLRAALTRDAAPALSEIATRR